ncbi:MAG: head-tail adaptor protein [Firmicutes bacterium]|nr:head-tail adaptor protein [Bacillota bacterium]
MSYGKINSFIEIVTATPTKDAEGFAVTDDTVLANVRAYFEPKNSTEKWSNRAVFAEASALFRFRAIPGLKIETSHVVVCGGQRYNILSVEDVRGRGMYIEVTAKAQKPSVG